MEVAPERAPDLRLGLAGRRGREAEHGRLPELRERRTDEEVVGPEVVPPHADAVHLVDDHEPDLRRRERRHEVPPPQPLGRGRSRETRPAASAPSRASTSSAGSEELTTVARSATAGGSLSTWSFISAISGERTTVGRGRSIAASWYGSDLPDPVGIKASVSRPARALRTTSSWPGRNAVEPEEARECRGEVVPLHRASVGRRVGLLRPRIVTIAPQSPTVSSPFVASPSASTPRWT